MVKLHSILYVCLHCNDSSALCLDLSLAFQLLIIQLCDGSVQNRHILGIAAHDAELQADNT